MGALKKAPAIKAEVENAGLLVAFLVKLGPAGVTC